MSEGVMTYEECLAEAEKKGLCVVVPKDDELFVDIDDAYQLKVFYRMIPVLEKMTKGLTWSLAPSPSLQADHFHITVRLPSEITPRDRILLQAILGSDPMREILSLQRLDDGNPHPTLFFERKPAAVVVETPGVSSDTDPWVRNA